MNNAWVKLHLICNLRLNHKLIIVLCMSVNIDWQNSENLFWFYEYAHPLISVKKKLYLEIARVLQPAETHCHGNR